ncbi:MAG TPA: hypothetical protein VHN17_13050 [Steroidobacteraceae bacterium]|jgi:hypothetical protein|nr:hypothetical protein [Steroidobacteraceae bacterium]
MTQQQWAARGWATLALSLAAGMAAAQDDPCAKFTWNIQRERALFASAPQAVVAGHDASSAPPLAPERPYQLQLAAAGQITLLLPPGKNTSTDGAYAGMARLRLAQPGSYRVSVDQPLWIDVVADGKMIQSVDFQGRPGCLAPHKIVQYSLPGGRELLLQLSGAPKPVVRLTITATG